MIARGTAALFAHLAHYRQLRVPWAISLTGDKCGMALQQRKHCSSLLLRTIPDAELLISLLLVFLIGAGMEYVQPSPLPTYRGVARCTWITGDGAGKTVQRLWHLAQLVHLSIHLSALPWMLPKHMSFCNSIICSHCRNEFQPLSPANFEQLSNWFTG